MAQRWVVKVWTSARWVGAKLSFYDDVEEEEVNKEFGRETLDKFVEVKKLEENRKYAFSKTQLEVSGLAGAQV